MTPNPAAPVVEIAGLDFGYGGPLVLEGVDLTVAPGEFLGLVGPNGGGKSTLLRVLLGLLTPTHGRVQVLGTAPRQARRRVGYVPQVPPFARDFPISVLDVVLTGRFGLGSPFGGLFGPWRRADRAAALAALAEVEAADLAGRQIGTLSGGQLQRALLARALVGEPSLLILDEPTANIDQRMEGEVFDLLARLNRRLTIIVVSHDIAFISGYVSRVACLNRTLVCHTTDAIDGPIIDALYGEHVRRIGHHHHPAPAPILAVGAPPSHPPSRQPTPEAADA